MTLIMQYAFCVFNSSFILEVHTSYIFEAVQCSDFQQTFSSLQKKPYNSLTVYPHLLPNFQPINLLSA